MSPTITHRSLTLAAKPRLLAALTLLGGWLGLVGQAAAESAELEDLRATSLTGDKVELKLEFDGTPPKPSSYTINEPARISLDLPGVSNALQSREFGLGDGNARSVTVLEGEDRTRLVIKMTSLTKYATKREGSTMHVLIGAERFSDAQTVGTSQGAAESSAEQASAKRVARSKNADEQAQTSPSQASGEPSLKEVDFRRGDEGGGKVIVTLSDPSIPVDVRQEGGQVIVSFVGAQLPERLNRRLDVTDFATPVKTIDTRARSGKVRMEINPEGHYQHLAYQTDKRFVVNVKPITEDELQAQKEEAFKYTGDKLSLNFQDIQVRAVLQLIADFTGMNLVASDTVAGNITLRLKNVPWDQALDLILKTKGLGKRKKGNVLMVAPADEIAAREKMELRARQQVQKLAPLRTEYIQIDYADASQLKGLLEGGGLSGGNTETGGGGGSGASEGILGSRGSAVVDGRTNTLILRATEASLENARQLIEKLDVPVRQVLIESRIVIATQDYSKSLGVRWGAAASVDSSPGSSGVVSGSSENLFNSSFENLSTTPAGQNMAVTGSQEHVLQETLVTDLGVAQQGASSLSLGWFSRDTGILSLELSALEADGRGEVVSTPKVLTADQKQARIATGQDIPYQEATASGATNVQFKEAVLSMEVTPHITPDNSIVLDLNITQDSLSGFFGPSSVPIVDTNDIQTQVLADNGQTVVLGGVFEVNENKEVDKTPFLGDLPIIGRFFKRRVTESSKRELLVFITPKLVEDVASGQ